METVIFVGIFGFLLVLTIATPVLVIFPDLTSIILDKVDERLSARRKRSVEKGRRLASESDSIEATLADHAATEDRWARWHTDLDLLIEYPAIHDSAHETFARRIIDADDAATTARTHARAGKLPLAQYRAAVDEFTSALNDGEHQAKLIARGPILDPVLKRTMDAAETLLHKIRAYTAGDPTVSWAECQTAATGLTKLLDPIVETKRVPELETAIARELETLTTGA